MTIKHYIRYLVANGKQYSDIDWTIITCAEFENFVASPDNLPEPANALMPPSTTTTNTLNTTGQGQQKPITEADLFRKNVCRGSSLFPTLKDDAFHTKWTETTTVIAKSQLVDNVLDVSFYPLPAQEELFYLQCNFMLSVWAQVLNTDKSKSILKKHLELKKKTAAQDVWRELQEYFKNSTTGKDQTEKYHNYCANTKINGGKWKGSSHSYILHFQQQVQNYNKYATTAFTDDQKLQHLQQAMSPITELRTVKATNRDTLQGSAERFYLQ